MNKVPLLPFSPPDKDSIPLEVKRIESLPKRATQPQPHRHTFYVIFWATAGSGTHYLDFVGDEVRPHSLHFVGPGQVHYWDLEDDLQGYVVVFESQLFLEKADRHLMEQLDFFHPLEGVSVLNPPAPNVEFFQHVFERLEQEYQESRFGRPFAVRSWLRILLIEAQRLAAVRNGTKTEIPAEKQLANRYVQLVEQNAIQHHKVAWYANQLGVTVAHLSKSVKSALGLTAGELLRNRILLEAKRLLVHTDETAAAIALQLNFKDASYFGRFFKRETNQTPRQFRNQLPTKYQNRPTA